MGALWVGGRAVGGSCFVSRFDIGGMDSWFAGIGGMDRIRRLTWEWELGGWVRSGYTLACKERDGE